MRRLREDEVVTYNETDYSTMVGDLVNDAMIKVQNAHNWSQLQTRSTITTSNGTATYEIANSNQHTQIHHVYNDTSNHSLQFATRAWIDQQEMESSSNGPPYYWSYASEASDGDITLQFWQTPDATYSISVLHNVKQDRMTDGADVLLVPAEPVIQLARCSVLTRHWLTRLRST
jgi:hypothetical protein